MRSFPLLHDAMKSFLGVTFRKVTLAFVVPGMVLLVAGLSLGSAGVIPVYLGAAAVCTGYVLTWRRPRSFIIFGLASLISFPVGVLLHNFFYAMNEMYGNITVLHWLFEVLHVVFFVLAVVFSPAGVIIGITGWLVLLFRKRGIERVS